MKIEKQIVTILMVGFCFVIGIVLVTSYIQANSQTINTTTVNSALKKLPGGTVSIKPSTTPTSATAIVKTNTSPSPASTTNTKQCIITIDGQKYDVYKLQFTHSGGNVFTCGADNTSVFYQQHNKRFLQTRMTAYKV